MKALGGRGMYPSLFRLPGGHPLRVGAGAGVSAGGKRVAVGDDEAVFDICIGCYTRGENCHR